MPESIRLFLCARCRCQVFLCRRCDRGQVYCLHGCAVAARRQSRLQAAHRYARSVRGRTRNALRQRRFRQRRRDATVQTDPLEELGQSGELVKVTHQGSPAVRLLALLASPTSRTVAASVSSSPNALRCHGCGNQSARFVRRGFLPPLERRRRPTVPAAPMPP